MFTTTQLGQTTREAFEKDYVLVEGDGLVIRTARISDEEAENTNQLFRRLDMGRRWMLRGIA
jgi:hypothetical protein